MTAASGERFRGTIGVIGCGRLGAALALGLAGAGYQVGALASRDGASARRLAERLEARTCSAEAVTREVELAVLAVPDGTISGLASSLPWRAGQAAVHCSGALGLQVLAPAREAGALTGCLHPLQAFPESAGAPERFRGITCGIEGDAPLDGWLATMAADLGAVTMSLDGVDRAQYHAAAVFASNYAVALMAAAARSWQAAGLAAAEARPALAPLLRGATEHVEARELAEALTGPIARGDVATVARHLEALAGQPELLALYRALGRELLGLPLRLDAGARARLVALLEAR